MWKWQHHFYTKQFMKRKGTTAAIFFCNGPYIFRPDAMHGGIFFWKKQTSCVFEPASLWKYCCTWCSKYRVALSALLSMICGKTGRRQPCFPQRQTHWQERCPVTVYRYMSLMYRIVWCVRDLAGHRYGCSYGNKRKHNILLISLELPVI